jgi:hypothetical protein
VTLRSFLLSTLPGRSADNDQQQKETTLRQFVVGCANLPQVSFTPFSIAATTWATECSTTFLGNSSYQFHSSRRSFAARLNSRVSYPNSPRQALVTVAGAIYIPWFNPL